MKRPMDVRAAPKGWLEVLRATYPYLRQRESIGDLVLFGSQALSVYMKNPLRSKDLDLLSEQVSLHQLEELSSELSKIRDVECRSTTVQTKMVGMRKMTTYAVELRVAGKPFFIELFDSILDGRPLSVLAPYLALRKKWGVEVWVPEREAILALRLAFRRPEGISRLNALRLNGFMRENRESLSFNHLASILKKWRIEKWVETNLTELYRRHKIRIVDDDKIIPGIGDRFKGRK